MHAVRVYDAFMHYKALRSVPILAIAALFAGCSGANNAVPSSPASHGGVAYAASYTSSAQSNLTLAMNPRPHAAFPSLPASPPAQNACNGSLKFVSDDGINAIHVVSGSNECATLQLNGLFDPQGLDVDKNGTLYVADLLEEQIWELKPPYTKVSQTLSDQGEYPAAVAVCNGYIAVTNLETDGSAPGSVSIYRGNATSPTSTLVDKDAGSEYFPTCDGAGNLFTSYCTHSVGSADSPCKPGKSEGRVNEWKLGGGKPIELGIVTQFPGGLDWHGGNLYVGDQDLRTVGIYRAPFKSASGTINLTQAGDPIQLQIMHSGNELIDADGGANDLQLYALGGLHGWFDNAIWANDWYQAVGVATIGDGD